MHTAYTTHCSNVHHIHCNAKLVYEFNHKLYIIIMPMLFCLWIYFVLHMPNLLELCVAIVVDLLIQWKVFISKKKKILKIEPHTYKAIQCF